MKDINEFLDWLDKTLDMFQIMDNVDPNHIIGYLKQSINIQRRMILEAEQ